MILLFLFVLVLQKYHITHIVVELAFPLKYIPCKEFHTMARPDI